MRHVAHGREPRALVRYRESTPDADWDGFDHKADVLATLLRLQGSLCCYCSRAISAATAHVEHYHPRSRPPTALQLTWSNLFAVCDGSHGEHCDGSKADQVLERVHPGRHPEREVRYSHRGAVEGRTDAAQRDVVVLNLMHETLRDARLAAFRGLWRAMPKVGTWGRADFERAIEKLEAAGTSMSPVLIAWLRHQAAKSKWAYPPPAG